LLSEPTGGKQTHQSTFLGKAIPERIVAVFRSFLPVSMEDAIMFRTWRLALMLTGVAALLWTAGPLLARGPHGGGSGFHGGHVGGSAIVHAGGVHGGPVGGFHGGFHTAPVGGGWHGGHVNTWHGGHEGWRHGVEGWRSRWGGYGYGPGYGVYGLWPYANSGLYRSYYPYGSSYLAPYTVPDYYDFGDSYDYGSPVLGSTTRPSTPVQPTAPATTDTPAPAATDNTAHVDVKVPADAVLWVEGTQTRQTGTLRHFVSPPLTPGRDFTYDIRAQWTQDGQPVEVTRHVPVRAGGQVLVNFLEPSPAP
jgi:uncharacterized protein (TIGR03000 family)